MFKNVIEKWDIGKTDYANSYNQIFSDVNNRYKEVIHELAQAKISNDIQRLGEFQLILLSGINQIRDWELILSQKDPQFRKDLIDFEKEIHDIYIELLGHKQDITNHIQTLNLLKLAKYTLFGTLTAAIISIIAIVRSLVVN